ncbi:MAG: Mrp/NBP35 family ATP-binding protein [Dehalococcoidia bacterium]|nr:Mrp/NBP35 family ATP-binding protein [Dehalococcoidia bacterium]
MLTRDKIAEALNDVLVPGITYSIIRMNLVQDITITEASVKIVLASTALNENAQVWIKEKISELIKKLDKAVDIEVEFIEKRPLELNSVNNIIAVMSGKGGVGKSLVTGLTAIALCRQGYTVGILDADITGPSIPKMFGISTNPQGNESGILPVLSANGIEIISINLFLPSEDEAVIWRGPLIGKAITQFWEDVLWGKLDYLLIDLPPGTADAPLTALQVLPVSGAIIVFTPQDLTTMIVKKAVKMAQQMNKPVLGVVENMSYLYVPEIRKQIEIFGKSRGDEMSKAAGAPLLAKIPIDPKLALLCDEGHIERYDSEILTSFSKALQNALRS